MCHFDLRREKLPGERKTVNYAKLVIDYVSDVFGILNAHQTFRKIELAFGAMYDFRKSRQIVVMFNRYSDKLLVKQKTQET
jgi:hypothetical protein